MKYFLWLDDKEQGPFDEAELRQMLERQQITKTVLARQENSSEWAETSIPAIVNPPPSLPPAAVISAHATSHKRRWTGQTQVLLMIVGIVMIISGCADWFSSRANAAAVLSYGIGWLCIGMATIISLLRSRLDD